MISIPRDLWVPVGRTSYVKINSVYTYGEQQGEGVGIKNVIEVIDTVLGLDIHYYATADFEGFVKAVDALGGIDVDVEHSFVDPKYPTAAYGTQVVRFEAGLQHMDGTRALQYARSRQGYTTDNSGAIEGNDFARARRQQQVLKAVKEKVLSTETLLSPSKIEDVSEAIGDHVRTDMELWEALRFADLARHIDTEAVIQVVLDNGEGLLYSENGSAGYILRPVGNTWTRLHELARTIFTRQELESEELSVAVANGTTRTGVASIQSTNIETDGMNVVFTGNVDATKRPSKTRILLLVPRTQAPTSIELLEERYDVTAESTTYEQARLFLRSTETLPTTTDVLILLGPDAIP